jgi:hypothetical protein
MFQGTALGPAYIPAHGISQLLGGILGALNGRGFWDGTHRYNIFERAWIDVPDY